MSVLAPSPVEGFVAYSDVSLGGAVEKMLMCVVMRFFLCFNVEGSLSLYNGCETVDVFRS